MQTYHAYLETGSGFSVWKPINHQVCEGTIRFMRWLQIVEQYALNTEEARRANHLCI